MLSRGRLDGRAQASDRTDSAACIGFRARTAAAPANTGRAAAVSVGAPQLQVRTYPRHACGTRVPACSLAWCLALAVLAGFEAVEFVQAAGQQPPPLFTGRGVGLAPHQRRVLLAQLAQPAARVVEDQAGPFGHFQRCPATYPTTAGPILA